MKNTDSTNSHGSAPPSAQVAGFALWQWLKSKRISYLVLPLLIMATVTEFVILATGWKYQQVACLPKGMAVTLFGIGPIGATILAVELLKLPLAIWTASRHGWQKGVMLVMGLPLICLLTFQLVKDMAVYEMGVALTPASQMLEQASAEEIKTVQLKGDLTAIEQKKAARDSRLGELAAKKAKAKADLEESLNRNAESRQDAIALTDYQKKELSDVESRQATIIKQFDADTAQLTKAIAELHARRETEVGRATKWNAEEARIENAYKAKMVEYANKKAAYEKDLAEYTAANFLKRQVMKEPVDPGVPPVRETNTILKPAEIAELDTQLKAKESELLAVNNRRRDRIAQVEADARQLREGYDRRSSTKREEADKKREELLAAQAAAAVLLAAEERQIEQEFETTAKTADRIRAEIDASQKKAEALYESREASIKNTQVHRIATTVEIVRGLLFGKHPISITATSKERGDLYTDQISMVRIWVYPVLAFIVAYLPTLMVEIGFSTLFMPEQQRPPHRLGFFGRRLHWLYTRAGRLKILHAERIAREASAEIAARDEALATEKTSAHQVLAAKEVELQSAREALSAAAVAHEAQLKQKEEEWVGKLAGMAESLNQTVAEKNDLRDLQKAEIERQVQLRQNAWSDRLTQLRQELDAQRAASEAEREAMMQEHHKKQLELSEDAQTQVAQARRQAAAAELTAEEKTARLEYELKVAREARDSAVSQMQQQADALSAQLSQVREDAARESERAVRLEKQRSERQQLEFGKTLRQRDEDTAHQLKQREQELSLQFEARLEEEKARIEQASRRCEEELERQLETRVRAVDARWKQEVQQREDAAQTRYKQREQQLQAQAELRANDVQTQAEHQLRLRETELERLLETQAREAATRLEQELQQKELAFQSRLKQREQELAIRSGARETELQNQWALDLRTREEEAERLAESRVRATEARLTHEAQQKEEQLQAQLRQRDQQWQAKLDAARAEAQTQAEQALRRRETEADANLRELEASLRKEMQLQDEAAQAGARQREQELVAQFAAQAEARHTAAAEQWQKESEGRIRAAVAPIKAQLTRAEKERDEARQAAASSLSHAQDMETKLSEASSFLNGWKNGNGNGNGKHLVLAGR